MTFFTLMISKRNYTAAKEPINPKCGVYGMGGMEIWIEINIRMPAVARK